MNLAREIVKTFVDTSCLSSRNGMLLLQQLAFR